MSQGQNRLPRLYILRLHESPLQPDNNFERFDRQWILDPTDTTEPASEIQTGDAIFAPELLTGAGEMEGLRFVGKAVASSGYELLSAGIESPVFPTEITVATTPEELRQMYEPLIEIVLQKQGFSLQDLLGGADVAEQFWTEPDKESVRRETEGSWRIPLKDCAIESIHDNNER